MKIRYRSILNRQRTLWCALVLSIVACSLINRMEGERIVEKELLQAYEFRQGFPQPPHLTLVNITQDLIPLKEPRYIDTIHRQGFVHIGAWLTIVDARGRILVLKRGPDLVTCPSAWGLVGEHTVLHESPIDTARRAIREELGAAVLHRVQFLHLLSDLPAFYFRDYGSASGNRIDRQVTYLWWVQMDRAGEKLQLRVDEEVAEYRWLDPEMVEAWLQEARHNLEATGETGQRTCHETMMTLWELVMEYYKKASEERENNMRS